MASGKVDDYLEYKGIQICHSVMEHYGRSPDAGTEVRRSESDKDVYKRQLRDMPGYR